MKLIFETARLHLRPPEATDVPVFTPLIGDYRVSKNLSRVPHPYSEEDGQNWVLDIAAKHRSGEDYSFAITRKSDGVFIGVCGVHPSRQFEIGYWLGELYWGMGYATEAAHRVVRFAFEELGTPTVIAGHMTDNPASGRVLEKLGFVASHDEPYPSLSRGTVVPAHRFVLTRERFENGSVTA
jgi:RimJ/RimL family protein N-acetyltransferase